MNDIPFSLVNMINIIPGEHLQVRFVTLAMLACDILWRPRQDFEGLTPSQDQDQTVPTMAVHS